MTLEAAFIDILINCDVLSFGATTVTLVQEQIDLITGEIEYGKEFVLD